MQMRTRKLPWRYEKSPEGRVKLDEALDTV